MQRGRMDLLITVLVEAVVVQGVSQPLYEPVSTVFA